LQATTHISDTIFHSQVVTVVEKRALCKETASVSSPLFDSCCVTLKFVVQVDCNDVWTCTQSLTNLHYYSVCNNSQLAHTLRYGCIITLNCFTYFHISSCWCWISRLMAVITELFERFCSEVMLHQEHFSTLNAIMLIACCTHVTKMALSFWVCHY
jgi:hypothetical protein